MPKNQFNIKYISNFNKVKYFKCKINCFFQKEMMTTLPKFSIRT